VLALPEGARQGPNCGVTAIAIVAGVSFETAWQVIGQHKSGNWKGRTYRHDRIAALKKLGVRFKRLRQPSRTLQTFVTDHTVRGATYMVELGSHMVRVGLVADQSGVGPVAESWCRRHRTEEILQIIPRNP
jgi:hypothetical protein